LFPVNAGWPTVREGPSSTAKRKLLRIAVFFQLPVNPFSQALTDHVVAMETELRLKDDSSYNKRLLGGTCR
jgi:hypothetical protein